MLIVYTLEFCLCNYVQNFLKDLMELTAAYIFPKILQAGLRMFMYDFFFNNLFTYDIL